MKIIEEENPWNGVNQIFQVIPKNDLDQNSKSKVRFKHFDLEWQKQAMFLTNHPQALLENAVKVQVGMSSFLILMGHI